jgi:hypothetical protein
MTSSTPHSVVVEVQLLQISPEATGRLSKWYLLATNKTQEPDEIVQYLTDNSF